MKMNYKNRKKGKMFENVADAILESADCKCEIIWLLKKHFKDDKIAIFYKFTAELDALKIIFGE